MSFGTILKKLRTENNMTQEQLAKKINLSKANVSKYEADIVEPNLETLAMISVIFNVSTDYLLGHERAALNEQHLSKEMQLLIDSDLSEDELKKVIEYVDFLKSKRINN